MKNSQEEILKRIYETLCNIRDTEALPDPYDGRLNYAGALGKCQGQAECAIKFFFDDFAKADLKNNSVKNIEATKGDKTNEQPIQSSRDEIKFLENGVVRAAQGW
jgi:hypothetical protein